ncbi:EAL domain-containing protein [Mariprofundus erugo]|uniref:EAL domain-containing protein n=1 Tax=Mariprofundus erugo TaxID=2528639 RepID=A0A5R9GNT8_9PROT|nr:EAL domain-containing protein [Mariprofundus erugo]TLS65967.1 EAL domain-containing protein [Mariprofundus erugo]
MTLLFRYSWLLVLIAGLTVNMVTYHYQQGINEQLINNEINLSSQEKLGAIRNMLQRQSDVSGTLIAFMHSPIHPISDDEARRFMRSLLDLHTDTLDEISIISPALTGNIITLRQHDSTTTSALPDPGTLSQLHAGSYHWQRIDRDHGDSALRITLADGEGDQRIYAICTWNASIMVEQAIASVGVAGLDIDVDIRADDRIERLFSHSSRLRKDHSLVTPQQHYSWQAPFDVAGSHFMIHTRALPELHSQAFVHHTYWMLLTGLVITALLSLLLFTRTRLNTRLQSEVEIRTSELSGERQKLAAVIDHAHDCILVIDEEGKILRANPAAIALFGYPVTEWQYLTIHDLLPNDIREAHRRWFKAEIDGESNCAIGKIREIRGQRQDGSQFTGEIAIHAFTSGNARQFSIVLGDISQQKIHAWVQSTLLNLRATSQAPIALHTRLKEMLVAILSSPWSITSAAIYTLQGDQLWLSASHGWQRDVKMRHLTIAADQCLCGQSMDTGDAVSCDHMQSVTGEDMYCLPVIHDGKRTGLLHLRFSHGTERPPEFLNFCQQVQEIVSELLLREQVRQTLEDSETKHRQLVETTPMGIVIQCGDKVRFVNPAALKMLAASTADELYPYSIADCVYPDDRPHVSALMTTLQQGGHIDPTEQRIQRLDGTYFWADLRGVPIVYDGTPAVQVLIQDISDRKRAEEQLTLLSYSDELTGLPNRRLFIDRLEQACNQARRRDRQLCMLFLDLDRFKAINDTQGHACGDMVLQAVGERIRLNLRSSDTAARMGGDEFAVLLPETDQTSALHVAGKLTQALQLPIMQGGHTFNIGVSIGLACFPDDAKESDTLLKYADNAMYYAKQNHLDTYCFSSELAQTANRRIRLEQELKLAAERGQLQLHYQSQFSLTPQGNIITGVESLIRWHHPELGMVSPAEFIPLAEETGLIRPVTEWVISEASRQAIIWEQESIRPARISINISAVELMQQGLAEQIVTHIVNAGASPDWFEIEVTETAAMNQPDTAIDIMTSLAAQGIYIAIDDFGTGYSSLAYLKRLPAQHLKIDIAFIRDLPNNAEDAVIVRTIIAMAHSLGLKVVAEGVETHEQLQFLRQEGCDMIQGYLLGKPLTAEATSALLRSRTTAPSLL